MKHTIFKHLFLAIALILGVISCEDREIITIDNQSAPIMMDLSADSLNLDPVFPGNPALTITWQPATYTVPAEIKYKVEMSADETFENAKELISTNQSQTNVSFTTKEMNEAVKKIGFVPNEWQTLYLRVTAFLGDGDLLTTSNITSLNVKPYLASPTYEYTDLYLVGDATGAGWDNLEGNANMLPLQKTSESSKYVFTGYFTTGGFKMVKVKGSWDAQFGLGAAPGQLSTDGGSGNIPIDEAGYYKLSVNTADLSYTLEKVSTPTSAVYSSMSIIGTVNGNWDTDTQLMQSTFDPHVWMINSESLKSGEFKFRANNNWDVSWGTNAEFFGTATINGANIPLSSEWTYDVYFNDATGDYSVIPVK